MSRPLMIKPCRYCFTMPSSPRNEVVKNLMIGVRVTPKEHEAIHKAVRDKSDMTTSEYIRTMLLGESYIKP